MIFLIKTYLTEVPSTQLCTCYKYTATIVHCFRKNHHDLQFVSFVELQVQLRNLNVPINTKGIPKCIMYLQYVQYIQLELVFFYRQN